MEDDKNQGLTLYKFIKIILKENWIKISTRPLSQSSVYLLIIIKMNILYMISSINK